MAQFEYMDNVKINSDYRYWEDCMPKEDRKRLEGKYGYGNLFNAYLDKLGSEGWEISVGSGSYSAVYLAKRDIACRPEKPIHRDIRAEREARYHWDR